MGGRCLIPTFDNKPLQKAEGKHPYLFFASGGAITFGVRFRAAKMDHSHQRRSIVGFDPEATVNLPIDNFLTQKVLCIDGLWLKRDDVIKYVANKASGVHSGDPDTKEFKALERISRCVSFAIEQAGDEKRCVVNFEMDQYLVPNPPLRYDPKGIDPVLAELLAACHCLAQSDDIKTLESRISTELSSL